MGQEQSQFVETLICFPSQILEDRYDPFILVWYISKINWPELEIENSAAEVKRVGSNHVASVIFIFSVIRKCNLA
jgi:hypothetical protein